MSTALTFIDKRDLTHDELTVLGLHASGFDEYDIARELGTDSHGLRRIEKGIKTKLEARTAAHMVSQAWALGVIAKKLCLCLLIASSLAPLSIDNARLRTASRFIRNPTTITRTVQAGRNMGIA
ncbi:hypothetical protein A1OW_10385 [Enterovibrio norvegicus]|uniref:hypothetical protein n=1 Tax=Enterovibrio norvegicus TaxID=188144 RepID=UPI0002FE247A|nr:hypothetical protein [Enterovibrio norvegicus]OEF51000.1 hypothetical protein A1OW_10385 [Enterovibrio norvegicus]